MTAVKRGEKLQSESVDRCLFLHHTSSAADTGAGARQTGGATRGCSHRPGESEQAGSLTGRERGGWQPDRQGERRPGGARWRRRSTKAPATPTSPSGSAPGSCEPQELLLKDIASLSTCPAAGELVYGVQLLYHQRSASTKDKRKRVCDFMSQLGLCKSSPVRPRNSTAAPRRPRAQPCTHEICSMLCCTISNFM
eukprot:753086-Hanusia_phi.AAC.2